MLTILTFGYPAHGPATAAPQNRVLDNFNRANASTLGANWSVLKNFFGTQSTEGIISNQAYNPWGAGNVYLAMYWNASAFGPDSEVFATISTRSSTNDTDCPGLYLRCVNPGSSFNGYVFGPDYSTGTVHISRIDSGLETVLGSTVSQAISSGDKLWFEARGPTLNGYYQASGSGTWTLLLSRTDSIYATSGYIALYFPGNHTDDQFDDFGGGFVNTGIAAIPLGSSVASAAIGRRISVVGY